MRITPNGAPRRLAAVTGKEDKIFPTEGVRDSYKAVEEIYNAAGAPECCRILETPKHHYWCADLVWNTITRSAKS